MSGYYSRQLNLLPTMPITVVVVAVAVVPIRMVIIGVTRIVAIIWPVVAVIWAVVPWYTYAESKTKMYCRLGWGRSPCNQT